MNRFDKMSEVCRLAEQDEEYMKMQAELDRLEKKFHAFARFMPQCIRNILYGYQGMTYLRDNRKLLIACEHMEFKDQDPPA